MSVIPSITPSTHRPAHPRVPTDRIVLFAFGVIAIGSILNVNGIISMATGNERAVSIFYLAAAILIFGRVLLTRSGHLSMTMRLYILFMIAYVGCGMIGLRRITDDSYLTLNVMIRSIVITLASYFSTRHLLRSYEYHKFLLVITLVLSLASSSVFLTPLLDKLMYARFNNAAWNVEQRFCGFFGNPNQAGAAACLTIAFALGMTTVASLRRWKLILWSIVAVSALAVLVSFSRTSMIIFVTLSAYFGQYGVRQVGKSLIPLFVGMGLLGVSFWFFLGGWKSFDWTPPQAKRIRSVQNVLTNQAKKGDDGHRRALTTAGYKYWLKRPIFGQGLACMRTKRWQTGHGVHNTYMMVLGESGVIPFILFASTAISFYFASRRSWLTSVRLIASGYGIVFLLGALTSHNLLEHRNQNVIFGVLVAVTSVTSGAMGTPLQTVTKRRDPYFA